MKLCPLIILERSWRLLSALSPLRQEVARKSQPNHVKLINVLGPEVTRPSQLKQGITGGGCHKYHFCRDKRFVATRVCRAKCVFCRDKTTINKTCVCVCVCMYVCVCARARLCGEKRRGVEFLLCPLPHFDYFVEERGRKHQMHQQ